MPGVRLTGWHDSLRRLPNLGIRADDAIIRPANDLPAAVLDVHNFDADFPSQ